MFCLSLIKTSGPRDNIACREMPYYARLETICLHKNEENLPRWDASVIIHNCSIRK